MALEAAVTDARCIRGPQRRADFTALEESHADAELRVRDATLRRTQATVPGITAISSVA